MHSLSKKLKKGFFFFAKRGMEKNLVKTNFFLKKDNNFLSLEPFPTPRDKKKKKRERNTGKVRILSLVSEFRRSWKSKWKIWRRGLNTPSPNENSDRIGRRISIEPIFSGRRFRFRSNRRRTVETRGNSIDSLSLGKITSLREGDRWTNDSFLGELQASWIPS